MDQFERKKLDRDIQKILKEDADRCSVCGVDFPHNSKTFFGRVAGRKGAVAGECCADRLNLIFGEGVYLTKGYDMLEQRSGAARAPSTQEGIERAVNAIQAFVTETDRRTDDILQRSGITSKRGAINSLPTAWKANDAKWFEANPTRSHRLRVAQRGEIDALPDDYKNEVLPPRHEMQIVVRQVEPGARVRLAFARNLDIEIPDEDAVIHALFDIISNPKARADKVVSAEEVAGLAARYAPPTRPT